MGSEQIAQAIMDHARKNYNVGGWDYVVECEEIEQITAELEAKGITTVKAAIEHYGEIYGLINERREEARAMRE